MCHCAIMVVLQCLCYDFHYEQKLIVQIISMPGFKVINNNGIIKTLRQIHVY